MIKPISFFVLGSCIAALSLASPLTGQGTAAGARNSNGQVMTKLVLTMNEPGAYGRPAAGLTFLIVADDGDRTSIRTNEAGVASAWLAPGDYRFVTPDPLEWEGNAYTWDRVIPVRTGMRVIQLTQDDARSIALSAVAVAPARTAEPIALSSKPTRWKAADPPTEDLRPAKKANASQTLPSRPAVAGERSSPNIAKQNHQAREGFWFNIGTGYGAISCKDCYGSVGGYSGGLSLGGTISQRFLLGVGTTGWYRSEGGATLVAGTVDARVRFYPATTSGFFLTGGVGFGSIGADLAAYGSDSETGAGVVLGLGWDLRVANGVSLTPFWNGFAVATSNADANVGQVGLGITFH